MKISIMKNKTAKLFKWSALLFLLHFTVQVSAQSVTSRAVDVVTETIEGRVIDGTTNQALAGVRIQTSDPRFTAMSDENGQFSIKLPTFIHTLFVSAPGYDKREISVYTGERNKEIKIYRSVFDNVYDDEVTIFGDMRKRTITTALKSFKPVTQSSIVADNVIQSKLMGDINMTTFNGSPAAGSAMLIRGINSINSGTQPLIVIDGVIHDSQKERASLHLGNYFNPLGGLDVNDIESITVLKDGTSIYGSKGGNGVILINTNRGESMVTKITVSGALGYTMKPNLTPTMDAKQYRIYLSDLLVSPEADKLIQDKFFLNDDPSFIYYNKFHNDTDWKDGIYRNGTSQSYNVSVNGGDEIALYNLSVGMTNTLSTLNQNDFTRINARFNSDISLSDKLSTVFDISFLQATRKLRNDGIAEVNNGPINSPGYLSLIKSPFLNPFQYSAGSSDLTEKLEDYDFLGVANPRAILKYGLGHSQQNNFSLLVLPKYEINKNLNVSTQFSYALVNISENMYSPMYGVAPYIDKANKIESNNHVKTQFARQSSITSDTKVNWKKSLEEHNFNLNAGIRFVNSMYKMEFAQGHNTGSDQVREMSGSLQYRTAEGVDDPYKWLSYYGVFNYGWKDRYFAEAAVSMETSSLFGNKTQTGLNMLGVGWGLFPSLNAAWLISSEDFMRNVSFVNLLKLRAGFGLSGNDGIESTAAKNYFRAVKYSDRATGVEINNIANPTIQWETVTKINLGLDATIANDRIDLSLDLFNNTTNNLLSYKTLDYTSGIGYYWENDGKLQNRGFEVGLNAHIVRMKDFNFTLGATVGHYSNKILALAGGDYLTKVYGAEVLTAVGQPLGQFYGYKTNGVFATAEQAADANLSNLEITGDLTPFEAGDVWFVDQDKNNVIDENDKVVIGNTNPDLFGSISAGLAYKRFRLNALFNYSYGNDVYNYLRSQVESGSTFSNQSTAMNNRWVVEGQQTLIPRSTFGDPLGNNRFSDRWVEDGSYLRLKTIELSYDIPMGNITFLQGINVWASANNLFTLTNYLGSDPEFAVGNNIFYRGIDAGMLSQSKSFNFGFKVYL